VLATTALFILLDTERKDFIIIVNVGVRLIKSPIIVYLAEDAFPGRNWLARRLFYKQPKAQMLVFLPLMMAKRYGELGLHPSVFLYGDPGCMQYIMTVFCVQLATSMLLIRNYPILLAKCQVI